MIRVYDGTKKLAEKTDYTIVYNKNRSVTNGAKTALVKKKAGYLGTLKKGKWVR